MNSPTYLAGTWLPDGMALAHPAKLAVELARAATELGGEMFVHTRAVAIGRGRRGGAVAIRTEHGAVSGDRVVLATNASPSLPRRYRHHTLPVYDHVQMTGPLTDAQLRQIGWGRRHGVSDLSNQFHCYRLTADDRVLWGGYDLLYYLGGAIRPRCEDRDSTHPLPAGHFFTTFPQLEEVGFTHRWAGVGDTSTRFCAFFGSARGGRVAYAAGFTGLGAGAARFAADVMLDRLGGVATELTDLELVSTVPWPFPPEPLAALGINATRWSLDRADRHEGRRNLCLQAPDAVDLGLDS